MTERKTFLARFLDGLGENNKKGSTTDESKNESYEIALSDEELSHVHGSLFVNENGSEKEYLLIPRIVFYKNIRITHRGFEPEEPVKGYLIEVVDDRLDLNNAKSLTKEDICCLIDANHHKYKEDDRRFFQDFSNDTQSFALFKRYLAINNGGTTEERNIRAGSLDSIAMSVNNGLIELDVLGKHYSVGYHDFMKFSEDMSYNINNIPVIHMFDYNDETTGLEEEKERKIIRDYIVSDLGWPEESKVLDELWMAFKRSRLDSKEGAIHLLEAYLYSLSNEQIRGLYKQEQGMCNLFYSLASTSYEDIMMKKINILDEDNNFFDMLYLQRDGERLNLRITYIDNDTYAFDVIKDSTKEKGMDTMYLSKDTLEDVITTNEDILKNKEFNRRENLPWFFKESKDKALMDYMSQTAGKPVGGKNSSRSKQILESIIHGETVVLNRIGAAGTSVECHIFEKCEGGILNMSFKTDSPTVRVFECRMSPTDNRFEEKMDGSRVYKVHFSPFGTGSDYSGTVDLIIQDDEIDLDCYNKILSGMDERSWAIESTKEISIKNNGKMSKDIAENDRKALDYINSLFTPENVRISNFIRDVISKDLRADVSDVNPYKTKPSATYFYESTYKDGAIKKRIVNFTKEESSYIDINIIDCIFDANGDLIGTNIEAEKEALNWDGNFAKLNPQYEDYTSMIIKDINKNKTQLYKTEAFNKGNYSKDKLSECLTEMTKFFIKYRFGVSEWGDIYESIVNNYSINLDDFTANHPKASHCIYNAVFQEYPNFKVLDEDVKKQIIIEKFVNIYKFYNRMIAIAEYEQNNNITEVLNLNTKSFKKVDTPLDEKLVVELGNGDF
ncbi:MAG: hypothetical protein K5675_04615 [Lachnospiraceae bacterium]|nr:hypothetical protein [Lachnospiraceae bacterium]